MSRKLSIVTNNSSVEGKIRISGDQLCYENETGETIIITDGDLKYRPLHCSELYNKFLTRGWNKTETLFIKDNNLMYRKYDTVPPSSIIDEINPLTDTNSFPLCGESYSRDIANRINEAYNNIFGNTNANEEICFLNTTRSLFNPEWSVVLDYCGPDSYTNTINLTEPIKFYSTKPGIQGKVDLSVLYTIGENLYTYNTTFCSFKYDSSDNLILEDLIETDGYYVEIEYIGGIIKAIPISKDVTECIINKCSLTYGKLSN